MRIPLLLLSAFAVASVANAQSIIIPNGDFEAADDSLTWLRVDGVDNPGLPVTFETGGNLGGYASVTPAGGWGILVGPVTPGAEGGGVPIIDLGLSAGGPVTFTLDMKNLDGPGNVGGMKVEAWGANALVGNTGDIMPALIGDGTTWETYNFDWTLPVTTDKLIFVPLWDKIGSAAVGYDNIGVVPEPSTFALLGGLLALGFVIYRRRK